MERQRGMADLLIRDLDATTHDLLRRRAEQAGRSLHAEIKRILEAAAHVPDVEAAHVLADQIAA